MGLKVDWLILNVCFDDGPAFQPSQNTEWRETEKRQQSCRTPKPLRAERFGPERFLQGLIYRPVVSLGIQYAAALDFVTAFEDDSNGFGIDFVFLFEDAGGEGVFGVVVFYRDD